jgi:hypothetical protein
LAACFEVPESGDDGQVVVDGVTALPEYVPVFESGYDVFDGVL